MAAQPLSATGIGGALTPREGTPKDHPMKLIAYKTALTLILEVVLPVVAFFSGYRPRRHSRTA